MKVIAMQDRRISFQDLWKGLALDKEYGPNCEKLLDDCLSKYDLTKDDFTGTVADNNCHDKLVRIWLGYGGLPFYFPGKEQPVSFDIDGIKPTTFLKEASLPEIEVSKHDLWWFLFFKQDNFPLPAPDVKDKTFWFHGQSNSTEQNKISEEPIWDEKLDSLVYDITMLEGRSYTEDRKKEKRQQVELSIKKQQDDLHKLYCDKKGYPIVGSDEHKVLWSELHRFYKIKVELDEAKRAEYNQWRLERKRLLKREIEAIEGWCRGERKSPTTGEDEVLVDFPSLFAEYPIEEKKGNGISRGKNYFILRGDFWRVRFNGGKEVDIKDTKAIRTLVAFLERQKGEEIDCADLYTRLHFEGVNDIPTTNDDREEYTQVDNKHNEVADPEMRTTVGNKMKELIQGIEIAEAKGDFSKAEKLETQLETSKKFLREEYNAIVRDNGSIKWNHCQFKGGRERKAENITRQIDRLIEKFKRDEERAELGEHLKKYLRKNYFKGKMGYTPPDGFQEWVVTK